MSKVFKTSDIRLAQRPGAELDFTNLENYGFDDFHNWLETVEDLPPHPGKVRKDREYSEHVEYSYQDYLDSDVENPVSKSKFEQAWLRGYQKAYAEFA